MNGRGLRWSEAALAGAGTGLAVLLAEGCAAAASRPSYRAAVEHGAGLRLVAAYVVLFALAGVAGFAVARLLGARGEARRGAALRGALLGAALPVLVHPFLAPPAPIIALWPSELSGVVPAVPLLLLALFARGRGAVLVPAAAAGLAALLAWWLLGLGSDLAPPGAPADEGWATTAPALLVAATLLGAAALGAVPLARGLRDAALGPARPALLRAVGVQLAVVLAGGWLVASDGAAPGGAPRADRPPVLLIVADTLRADHVSGFGAADGLTPHIAALERDGTSFTTAWSAAPWTTPSFGSLLTGRLPLDHGAGGGPHGLQPLNPAVPTLAEALAARGWQTVALPSNPLLGRQLGLARGFSRYEDAMPPEWYHPVASWLLDAAHLALPYLPASAQAARALAAVDAATARGASPCVLAHFMDSHWPQQSPARLRDAEPPGLPGDYTAAVRSVDEGVGALLDGLRARGLYDGALIVFTADHGEELEEHRVESLDRPPWNLHGHTLYEELLHVPLVVKLPRGDGRLGPPGTRREDPVSLLDVCPTLLAALGSLPPPDLAGVNLLQPPQPRILLAECLRPDAGRQALAARRDEAKLIVQGLPPALEHAQQFDLRLDPGERRPGPPGPGSPLFEALVVRCLRLAQAPAIVAPVPERPLDAGTLRLLGQLGYLR